MPDRDVLSEQPWVNNQGDKGICVRAALCKPIVAGLEKKKWIEYRFDAGQEFVLGLLMGDRDDTYEASDPCDLNRRVLRIKNRLDNKWTTFRMEVISMTKDWFRQTWRDSNKEYLVGHKGHCYYVEEVKNDGELLCCLNSWGKKDPTPEKETKEIADDMLFSVQLFPEPTKEELKLAESIIQEGKIDSPEASTLTLLAKLSRWDKLPEEKSQKDQVVTASKPSKLPEYERLQLSGNIETVDPLDLANLVGKASHLFLAQGLVLSKIQCTKLAIDSQDPSWGLEWMSIQCSDYGETLGIMAMMTKTVWIHHSLQMTTVQAMGKAAKKVNKKKCKKILFWGGEYENQNKESLSLALNRDLEWRWKKRDGDYRLLSNN